MTPDDLFVDDAADAGFFSDPQLRIELLESLRRGAVDGVDDLDVAQALGELLRSDFMRTAPAVASDSPTRRCESRSGRGGRH